MILTLPWCYHDVYMLIRVCSTSSRHDTVSTNTLGTLPCSATVLNLRCFRDRVWLVHIQHPDISIVDTHQGLTCSVCTSVPNNIVYGLAIGISFTHALLSVFTSSRVPVHDNRHLLSAFALYCANRGGVRGRVRLCPGRVCKWGSRDDYQRVGRARSVHARHVEGACRWVMGRRLVTGGWRRRGKKWWTNSSTTYVLIVYPRSKLTFVSRSMCTILPTPRRLLEMIPA